MENSISLPLASIAVGRYNPRRFFDPVALQSMADSVKAQGLHQPILVRQIGEGYELVAGERRYRAFKMAFGEDAQIPVYVRELTDEQANAAALTENIEREPMTPVEEAEAASKCLGDCLGDRAEAAKRLGWSAATLDRRLALMYATDKVRGALQERRIDLGHAELLATCRKESQDAALEHILKQDKRMSVADLKNYIETNAQLLEKAIFDKADCAGCHHNSSNQGALFAEAITDGRCTNKQCYETKTEAEVKARADALVDEYQVVRIVRPGENLVVIPLTVEGPKGVGAEQATACKTCKDYGAVVSAVPDKMGKVFKGMCMNVPCNTKHVEANAKAIKDAEASAKAVQAQSASTNASTTQGPVQGKPASAEAAKQQPKTPGASKAPANAEPSNRIKEYREKLWRKIYARVVPQFSVQDNRTVLMALCMFRPQVIDNRALATAAADVVGEVNTSTRLRPLLVALADLDAAKLSQLLAQIAGTIGEGHNALDIQDVVDVLRFFEVKLEQHWKITKAFCDLLTKNELDAVCEEIGLKAAMGPEYAKARNGSKEEFIQAVLQAKDFQFEGKIPKLMAY